MANYISYALCIFSRITASFPEHTVERFRAKPNNLDSSFFQSFIEALQDPQTYVLYISKKLNDSLQII